MIFLIILLFLASCFILFWSGSKLVESLGNVASYLGWREFVVAFFIVAVAASLPNLFVGINASLQGVTALSFGQIMGNNVIDLTLAIALAVLIGGSSIKIKSRMVQSSALFTAIIAVIPLLLILDGNLSRMDGLALILTFIIYTVWIFSKGERFKDIYSFPEIKKKSKKKISAFAKFAKFLKDFAKLIFYIILLLIASWGIVKSSQSFAVLIGVSVSIIGILLVGLGNAFPEMYFAIVSAKKGKGWLILGDLMGAIIISTTFVLGIIALIWPMNNIDFSPFLIARIFLVISSLFFLLFIKTGKEITKSEAAILLAIYFIFVFTEIAFQ
jgi:cation:H+ antiporter